MTKYQFNAELFNRDEPETLLSNIHSFISAFQETDSTLFAWMISHAARALYRHPEYDGSAEERCVYRRMSKQWKMLAIQHMRG